MRVILAALFLCVIASPSIAQEPEWYQKSVSLQSASRQPTKPQRPGRNRIPEPMGWISAQIIPHPPGCPARLFCGCGAAVRVFGSNVRSLWLAANWLQFPRSSPASGMVAARRGHVFVLEQHVSGDQWLATDYNSGGRLSRLHVRSIAGYTIVNPHARNLASIRS